MLTPRYAARALPLLVPRLHKLVSRLAVIVTCLNCHPQEPLKRSSERPLKVLLAEYKTLTLPIAWFDQLKIGRAACRERGCTYVSITVVAVLFKKNLNNSNS